MGSERKILLLDCDAMFCAVAKLVDPEGAGRARELIVGGGAQGDRGVVCSASYGAREKGVKAGMPMVRARRICPEAMCVPVPRAAVGEKSEEMKEALKLWSPIVEAASVDEFYLDMSRMEKIYPAGLKETARAMRIDVQAKTGMSVSIGGGVNKLIAKMAVESAKPRSGGEGVYIVEPGEEAGWIEDKQLREIPGVGPRAEERYKMFGWHSVLDVRKTPYEHVLIWLGEREAEWLWSAVWAKDGSEVEGGNISKSISHETTFAEDVSETALLRHYLRVLSAQTASEARFSKLKGRTVTVRVRDSDFTTRQASRTLPEAIETDDELYSEAKLLLGKLRQNKLGPLRLIGVGLSKFQSENMLEGMEEKNSRGHKISRLMDQITEKHGRDSISYGAAKIIDEQK